MLNRCSMLRPGNLYRIVRSRIPGSFQKDAVSDIGCRSCFLSKNLFSAVI